MSEPASVVLPAGTAAVLRALAGVETSFTIRHVARVAGFSPNRAHQAILRLAEHGLVLIDDLGGSRRCRLNREHLAAPAVINLVRLRTAMIELLQRQFSEWSVMPDKPRCSAPQPAEMVTLRAIWTSSLCALRAMTKTSLFGASSCSKAVPVSAPQPAITSHGSTSPVSSSFELHS